MKLLQKLSQSFTPSKASSPQQDLPHVAEEMYKKNFELAEKNRTLSILRKIDEIILSTVTDIKEIAQKAADVVATEAEFKAVLIFIHNKRTNQLLRLALSETDLIKKTRNDVHHMIFRENLQVEQDHNIILESISQRTRKSTSELTDLLLSTISKSDQSVIAKNLQIKSSIIYPLVLRGEVIGCIIFCLGQSEEELAPFQRDLIERLVDVIGIALGNALLYMRIQDANEKLKQLDRMKDEFVSLASHELRTPMTVIKSYLWMTINGKGGQISEKQRFYLDRAYKSTDRLIAFVNEMLNVSRIESNRVTISLKPIAIDELLKEVVSEISPRAQELGLRIITISVNNLPHVLADSEKIREVITNLIGNSLKFTPSGGTITISFKVSDGFVEVDIADNGSGMTNEDIPKLFHKFSMVGNNYLTKTNSQGTGLGLYIAKSIIELHGGKIWASSEGINKGSTFSFTLKISE